MTVTSKPETSVENRVAGWLTPEEFSILEAVCDTLLPAIASSPATNPPPAPEPITTTSASSLVTSVIFRGWIGCDASAGEGEGGV